MSGYTKLFSSIVHSTIWREPAHVKIVWITMLAISDKNGVAEASIPGLADLARVSLEDCEDALTALQRPDRYSRTTEHEGRRIAPVDGGWLLLNHSKYREMLKADDERERKRRWWAENRGKGKLDKTSETSEPLAELAETSTPDSSSSSDPSSTTKERRSSNNKVQEDKEKDKEATLPTHPLVEFCLELWPAWPQDQIEQSVLAWKSARILITEKILHDAAASLSPREPYSKIHTWVVRQAQFAARDAERMADREKARAGRPQPKFEPSVPEPPETKEQEAERLALAAECTAKIKALVGSKSLPEEKKTGGNNEKQNND